MTITCYAVRHRETKKGSMIAKCRINIRIAYDFILFFRLPLNATNKYLVFKNILKLFINLLNKIMYYHLFWRILLFIDNLFQLKTNMQ